MNKENYPELLPFGFPNGNYNGIINFLLIYIYTFSAMMRRMARLVLNRWLTNNSGYPHISWVFEQKWFRYPSGQFISMTGARYFSRIRSYPVTSRKRGFSPYDKLFSVFNPEIR